jgi:acyl-CoA thioesterase-1
MLCLAACSESAPVIQPVKVIAFGDSLTAGYGLTASESYPAKLQTRFSAAGHTGVRIMNMGISGDTTHNGLSRLNLVLEQKPDIVILELGANDIMRRKPAEDARKNLETIIKAMQEQGIEIIFCGVNIPAVFVLGNQNMSAYQPMFDDLVETYELIYVPNFLKNVQGKPEMNLQDQLHPNGNGTQEIANNLYLVVLDAVQDVVAAKQP